MNSTSGFVQLLLMLIWEFARADYYGLLSATLKNNPAFACDGEVLSIKCPKGTNIRIQNALYGRKLPSSQMCPGLPEMAIQGYIRYEDTNCFAPTTQKKVLDECEERQHCNIHVNSRVFGEDPCSSTSKYLEVTYKCTPIEFRNLVICESRQLNLKCTTPNQVIAIYSAMFGRTKKGNLDCPAFSKDEIECQAPKVLEKVMMQCHGRKECSMDVSSDYFGDPCIQGTHKYLSVAYTCVPKKILQKPRRFRPSIGNYLPGLSDTATIGYGGPTRIYPMTDYPPRGNPWERWENFDPNDTLGDMPVDSYEYPWAEGPVTIRTNNTNPRPNPPVSVEVKKPYGLVNSAFTFFGYLSANSEKSALYAGLSASLGAVFLLTWLLIDMKCQQGRMRKADRLERHAEDKPEITDTREEEEQQTNFWVQITTV